MLTAICSQVHVSLQRYEHVEAPGRLPTCPKSGPDMMSLTFTTFPGGVPTAELPGAEAVLNSAQLNLCNSR